ncbi:choline-phosphate cytidylyltransferase A [Striga asiatica]|uniref:Choline-phosphate cytidylyltransferase A n=1 Tax=Striga asiatica TaxID=4170 RepID=A0A5A7PQV0_STRAF|nr:choline-phosphate cytidylyltransferase A [Striga asiatica]
MARTHIAFSVLIFLVFFIGELLAQSQLCNKFINCNVTINVCKTECKNRFHGFGVCVQAAPAPEVPKALANWVESSRVQTASAPAPAPAPEDRAIWVESNKANAAPAQAPKDQAIWVESNKAGKVAKITKCKQCLCKFPKKANQKCPK